MKVMNKFKKVKIDPALQIISTVGKKGDRVVDAKFVAAVSKLCNILEGQGLIVMGDGIHRLQVTIDGLCLGYQLVATSLAPTTRKTGVSE